jgi:cytoskeletal protein CcmA (bactofilin family)
MLGLRRGRSQRANGKLTAFIDEGSAIEGKYTFSGTVMLNGRFTGEIVSTDTLIIGDKAIVHASIQAGAVLVSGEVLGNVVASQRVDLRGKARMVGDIDAPVVVVEEGVLFEGQCRMNKSRPSEVASVPSPRELSAISFEP